MAEHDDPLAAAARDVVAAAERDQERDEAQRNELDRLDERELRIRLLQAFDRFLELDVAVHMIAVKAVKGRETVEYRLAIYPDGADRVDVSKIQEVADEYRLDFTMDRDPAADAGGLDGGWIVVLHPRL